MDNDKMGQDSVGWLLYKERFFVLFVCMFSNFSAGSLWMSYSTIVDSAADYYGVDVDKINFLPICVLLCSVLFSLFAMYTLDKRSLKMGLRCGCLLISVGYFLRVMPKVFPFADNQRYKFSLIGHCFIGFGLPFIIFTPSKVAENWFRDSQRLFYTTIISVSYLSGLLFSDLVVEKLIDFNFNITDATIFIGIPSIISLILTFSLNKSKPKTPPSGSNAVLCFRPFFPSLAQLLKQKVFIILIFYIGIIMGSFISTVLIVQQLVKVNLKDIVFCGEFASFYIGGGLFGTLLSSLFRKRINNVILVMKCLVGGHSISSVLLLLVLKYRLLSIQENTWEIFILICSSFTGFFVYTIIPLGLDLGSNCSFPNCTEAASNGLLLISGQSFGLILTLLMRFLAEKVCQCKEEANFLEIPNSFIIDPKDNTFPIYLNLKNGTNICPLECTFYDYTISLMVQTVIIVIAGLFFIIFFDTEFRRMNNNRRFNVNRILSIEEVEDGETLYS